MSSLTLDFAQQLQIKDDKIFAPLKSKWLKLTPEERVRQEYIIILMSDRYGYSAEQMAQEVKVNNSKRGQGASRADILVWRSAQDKKDKKSPLIVVECKAQQVTIREEDYFQGMNYAAWAGADFFVTTNQKETKFFKVVKGEIPKRLDEIVAIPTATESSSDKKVNELLARTKAFTRDEFSKLLFRCHNIIRNNDKLSPEAAFDEISKILFMKIRYEREQARSQAIFSKKRFEALQGHDAEVRPADDRQRTPFYQYLFEQTKSFFAADELFETTDTLKVREASFLQIVKELEKYNLSNTSDDVKGIAFEKFLGDTFRGELGQYFTPRPVVDYIVDILDPQEGEIICDPCCGSGGFLIKAFEYVRDQIERHIQAVKEQIKLDYFPEGFAKLPEDEQEATTKQVEALFAQLNGELDLANPESRLRCLSYDCIFGTDANPRMARTAKMNMIMHGDGHGGVHHHDGLLNVNGIFDGRFDVILTNPPFGSRVDKELKVQQNDLPTEAKIATYTARYGPEYAEAALSQLQDHVGDPVLDLFDVGELSGLTEVLFLERCLNLLRPGGRLGVVLPEVTLNASSLQRVRDFIEGRAKLLNITSLPPDVFAASGATIKTSVVFLKKFNPAEAAHFIECQNKARAAVDAEYLPQLTDLLATATADRQKAPTTAARKNVDRLYQARKAALQTAGDEKHRHLTRAAFAYPVPLLEANQAGLTATGSETTNDLLRLAPAFRAYRHQHQLWKNQLEPVRYYLPDPKTATSLARVLAGEPVPSYGRHLTPQFPPQAPTEPPPPLRVIPLDRLPNWSVGFSNDVAIAYNPAYPLLRIGSFLRRLREDILIEDHHIYRRVTVRNNGQGLALRDEVPGREIGTKRQFLVHTGQFLLSRTDARHGAMGIVPPELDGAIVTNDFPVFAIDTSVIDPRYFVLITNTEAFIRFCNACSTGSASRQRLEERLFLAGEIPLPTLEQQAHFIQPFAEAERLRAEAATVEVAAQDAFKNSIFA